MEMLGMRARRMEAEPAAVQQSKVRASVKTIRIHGETLRKIKKLLGEMNQGDECRLNS